MSLKYVVCPGHVTSIRDGQRHYVGFRQLCDLYGVNVRDAISFDIRVHDNDAVRRRWPDAIWLYPDPSGKYRIPK